MDDLENEFKDSHHHGDYDRQHMAEAMLQGHMSYGRGADHDMPHRMQTMPPSIPLLTNGSEVSKPFIPCFFSILLCMCVRWVFLCLNIPRMDFLWPGLILKILQALLSHH